MKGNIIMKAVVVNAPGDIRIMEIEKPKPGPREVLARVKHCGVCATDLSIASGTLTLGDEEGMQPHYPVRIGHEWSGIIEEVGSETWRLRPGDRIISDTGYSCGECEMCLEGEYQNCENGRAIGTTGNCWPGAMAEYMLIPERLAFRVPDNVSLEEAALVEPSSIGFFGLLRAPLRPGKTLLVVGTGAIGLGGMACAKGVGIGKTMLAGRKDSKLEIGRTMGADVLINTTKQDMLEAVMKETNGKGADIVMDTTGDGSIFNTVMQCVRSSGFLVIPGFYEKPLEHVLLDNLIARNCTLVGAAGTANMGRRLLDMLSHGHMRLAPMITDRCKLEDVPELMKDIRKVGPQRIKLMVSI
jgi:L-iditol 2-dehydrogenase